MGAENSGKTRTEYGILSGIAGIVCNVLLSAVKLGVGLASHSTAVTADAFNNMSDAASSVIALAAARISGRPTDREHPFGYGRMEYIATLVIAVLIFNVGLDFLKSSVENIRNPQPLTVHSISLILLIISIFVKLGLFVFNKALAAKTDNRTIDATAMDSLMDAFASGAMLVSVGIYHTKGINIDGYAGLLISCIVLWSGIGIMKDSVGMLLGDRADPALIEKIRSTVIGYEGVVDVHDIILHGYGPGRYMGSLHVEVPQSLSLIDSHHLADHIEKGVKEQYGIDLVVHVDPTEMDDARVLKIRNKLTQVLGILDPDAGFHDLQVRFGAKHPISFDLSVPYRYTAQQEERLKEQISQLMLEIDDKYVCRINIDRGDENY